MTNNPIATAPEGQGASIQEKESVTLSYLFWTFLKIGSTAFGGFMSLISVVESFVVQRRKLMSHEDMLDGISLAAVLPGPMAVNVIAYVGYQIRGNWGALVTGIASLLPSYILLVTFSIYAKQFESIPAVEKAFMAFIPAMVAIILTAAWGMAKKTIKSVRNWRAISIAIVSALFLRFVGGFYTTLVIVLASGIVGYLWYYKDIKRQSESDPIVAPAISSEVPKRNIIASFIFLSCFLVLYLVPLPFISSDSLAKLFITFSGMSLLLFGSGYVFIPMIQELVVNTYGWITQPEFTNAIALGQITPGPILISAAAIGYSVKGILGSIVATVAIFFPPAVLMLTCSHMLQNIKQSIIVQAALKGIRPAVVGLIFTAGISFAQPALAMGQPIVTYLVTAVIFAGAIAAILKWQVEVALIIPIAGVIGILLYP
ncbi:chromate efflux transporter [Leptothoe sp. PORK10 BA2]|uniref:chromate efflux transporter n=1 Tax=Leptothoe sp. PORK10 BA2 TaxID=3110254 RepID=UPI002B1FFF93|nr:chromate efflux transporter [Leptothoe sp. PORK10 BA2]MEA5464342.1 chromate efflux transporter [Leptothoe sp. PORK10 BA2]